MNKIQYYLFWLKWKDKQNIIRGDARSSKGVSVEFYCITDKFKTSWENYLKLR